MTDVCKQVWSVNLMSKPKLRTYNTFKSLLEPEKYLTLNCSSKFVQSFARFRCSSLPLALEKGRHQGIDRQHRFCTLCKLGDVEDEYHFLLICPLYNTLRIVYLPYESFLEPNYYKFQKLVSSSDSNILLNLCKFVHKAIKLRLCIETFQ